MLLGGIEVLNADEGPQNVKPRRSLAGLTILNSEAISVLLRPSGIEAIVEQGVEGTTAAEPGGGGPLAVGMLTPPAAPTLLAHSVGITATGHLPTAPPHAHAGIELLHRLAP